MTDTTTKDDGDYLDYSVYAQTLWERIEDAFSKDALGDDPLVIGLYGEWGVGKSKLLDLIHKRAKAKNKLDCEDRSWTEKNKPLTLTVPVFFQPWKYEHEAHMGVPLLMHIQAAISETLVKAATPLEELFEDITKTTLFGKKTLKTKREAVKKWTAVIDNEFFQVSLGVAAGTVSTPPVGAATTAGLKWLANMRKDALKYTSAIEKWDTSETKATSNMPLVTQDGSYYYKTHEVLRKLTRIKKPKEGEKSDIKGINALRHDVNLNFVIFIDDLDRCLPEKSVQVLELIKTLLNVESFAFVLALDDEVMERGIGHRYRAATC